MTSVRPLNITGAIVDATDELEASLDEIKEAVETITTEASITPGTNADGVSGTLVQGVVDTESPTHIPNTVAPISINSQGFLRVTLEQENSWKFLSNPFRGVINYVRCSTGW